MKEWRYNAGNEVVLYAAISEDEYDFLPLGLERHDEAAAFLLLLRNLHIIISGKESDIYIYFNQQKTSHLSSWKKYKSDAALRCVDRTSRPGEPVTADDGFPSFSESFLRFLSNFRARSEERDEGTSSASSI